MFNSMKEFKLALVIQNIKGARKSNNNSFEISRSQYEKRAKQEKDKNNDVSTEVDRSSDIAPNNFLKITSLSDR